MTASAPRRLPAALVTAAPSSKQIVAFVGSSASISSNVCGPVATVASHAIVSNAGIVMHAGALTSPARSARMQSSPPAANGASDTLLPLPHAAHAPPDSEQESVAPTSIIETSIEKSPGGRCAAAALPAGTRSA